MATESPIPIARRVVSDGRLLEVWPLTYGRARLYLTRLGDLDVLDQW